MIKNDNLFWGYDKVWCVGRKGGGKWVTKECDVIKEYSNSLFLHCDDWETDGLASVFNGRYFYVLKDSSDLFIDKIEADKYVAKLNGDGVKITMDFEQLDKHIKNALDEAMKQGVTK